MPRPRLDPAPLFAASVALALAVFHQLTDRRRYYARYQRLGV